MIGRSNEFTNTQYPYNNEQYLLSVSFYYLTDSVKKINNPKIEENKLGGEALQGKLVNLANIEHRNYTNSPEKEYANK